MAAPTLSGSEFTDIWTGTSHTTAAISWGANVADMILVAAISIVANNNTAPSVSTVTDSLGLTWTRQASTSQVGITNGITSGPVAQCCEIWTAPAPGSPTWTGHTISVTSSSNSDSVVMYAVRVKNAVLAAPLDLNGSLPAHVNYNSASTFQATSLTGISTNTADSCVFAARCAAGAGNNINSGTFHIAGVNGDFGSGNLKNGTNFCILSTCGKSFTATQSGIAVDSGTSTANAMILAVAFTADSQAVSPVKSFGVVIS